MASKIEAKLVEYHELRNRPQLASPFSPIRNLAWYDADDFRQLLVLGDFQLRHQLLDQRKPIPLNPVVGAGILIYGPRPGVDAFSGFSRTG